MKIESTIISDYIFEQLTTQGQKSFQYKTLWFFIESMSQNGSEIAVKARVMKPHINTLGDYYNFIIKKES